MTAVGTFLDTPTELTLPDGRVLTTYSAGNGGDLVLLESGLSMNAAYWGIVADALSSTVRVVGYDRAGFGVSTPANDYRTLADLTSDLVHVIRAQKFDRLVLIGHSYGGPMVRQAVASLSHSEHERLAGVLLVDASDERCEYYFRPSTTRMHPVTSFLWRLKAWSGRLEASLRQRFGKLPEPYLEALITGCTTDAAARASSWELWYFTTGLRSLADGHADLKDIGERVTIITGQLPKQAGSLRESLIAAHRVRAEEIGARNVEATKSAHLIMVSEPEIIVQEALAFFQR